MRSTSVKSVCFISKIGILSATDISNHTFIDCSIIDPASFKQVGKAVETAIMDEFIDAPV